MRILITGANGFIGKKVISMLTSRGDDIFILSRHNTGAGELVWNFSDALPPLPGVDCLLHMAASIDFTDSSVDLLLDNTKPTILLADWCHKKNIPVIYTSTASVHGNYIPWGTKTPVAPANYYAVSKLLGEAIFQSLCPNLLVLRLAGVYGIKGPRHLGLNKAIDDALAGIPPTLQGSGSALRNYICVDDAAAWIVALLPNLFGTCSSTMAYVAAKESLSIHQYLQTLVDTLLPGKQIIHEEGEETPDVLVKAGPPPIILQSFVEYLTKIKNSPQT